MPKHVQRLLEQSQVIPSQREHAAAPDRVQLAAPSAILQRAALAPQSLRPPDIQRLQQTLGNRAVAQLLSQGSQSRSLVQAKLAINAPGDRYEQEADRVAEEVMRKPGLQRAEAEEREDEDETPSIMTKPQPSSTGRGAFEANEGFERQLQAARGQGRPLPPALKENFETKFGADFGGVRIHADLQADQLSRSMQARAFTTGQDVFFRRGAYQPKSHVGQKLVAHELTHVVQQSGGPQSGRMIQRDVGFEFETDWGIHGGNDPKKTSNPELEKHHGYQKYDGFELQVDEASRGFKAEYSGLEYQIEFVVEPHPETDAGGVKLQHTMEKLLEVVRGLEAKARKYSKWFRLHEPGDKLCVFPNAKDTALSNKIQARPQSTVGLSLSAIQNYGIAKNEDLGQISTYVSKVNTVQNYNSDLEAIALNSERLIKNKNLRGLVTLLAFYIYIFHDPAYRENYRGKAKGKQPEDYAKGALPILAKTNFAEMFSHLDPKEWKKYRKDPDSFVNLVLGVVNSVMLNDARVDKTNPVIPTVRVAFDEEAKVINLTLEDWIKSIPKDRNQLRGEDKLSEQHYSELFGFGNLGGKQGKGGTGDKVDRVPVSNQAAMVIEFRSGVPNIKKGFLLPEKWAGFAFAYYNLVRRLHSVDT